MFDPLFDYAGNSSHNQKIIRYVITIFYTNYKATFHTLYNPYKM